MGKEVHAPLLAFPPPAGTMAETLRRLVCNETCRILHEKLENWCKDYHVSALRRVSWKPGVSWVLRKSDGEAGQSGKVMGYHGMYRHCNFFNHYIVQIIVHYY